MKILKQISKPWNLSETRVPVFQPALSHVEAKGFCCIINSVCTRGCGSLARGTLLWNVVPEKVTTALPPSIIFWREEAQSRRQTFCGLLGDGLHSAYTSLWCGLKGKKVRAVRQPVSLHLLQLIYDKQKPSKRKIPMLSLSYIFYRLRTSTSKF